MNFNKKKAADMAANDEVRVYVYVGPSIKGVITNGSIYRGTRSAVLAQLEPAVQKYPKIERFIVADKDVSAAKEKLKKGNNGLSAAYRALQSEI